MKKLGVNELRELFLNFFEQKEHYRFKSFPLVPQNDHSLLLINAGMAPLKPYFTGELTPPAPRATSCQKCIRTPDIENVGKDARHGTYFEMLGNFSFGDYFKREACSWAWEFITEVLELPVDRLYVSVFHDDNEAYDIWTQEIGVDPSHMVRLGREDNFWEIGSGPCGPCSEIYFDRGEQYRCHRPDCSVGCDCDRYVEFWNLVFTQFNSDGKGNYTPLEKKNIDTGMGLERLACIMQEVESLLEIDTVARILAHVCRLTDKEYGADAKTDVSLRIITDHIRSTTMMICDGIMPSNAGRGYVLRRLLRRAARHGRLLGVTEPFLYELCRTVIAENENAYPELKEKETFITAVIRAEEERFGSTVETGLARLEGMVAELKAKNERVLSGADAFKLYDTDGLPVDLTLEILAEHGLEADIAAFEKLMHEQRDRAKKARGNTADLGWEDDGVSLHDVPPTEFCGYTETKCSGRVLAIVRDGEMSGQAGEGDSAAVLTDRTPFYAESGGQTADRGYMTGDGFEAEVLNVTKTPDGKYIHQVRVARGRMDVGAQAELELESVRRAAISRAHSATHLLQKALRETLGDHVEQSGSLVEPDRLRFDFSHFSAVTPEQIAEIEDRVNGAVLAGLEISVSEMPVDEAKKLGAMALFGEKYGDVVRVVRMGDYSIELCGGTHLDNTAKVGGFKILSEASVAAGIRRVEACCGMELIRLMRERESVIASAAETLKTAPAELVRRAAQVTEELRQSLSVREKLESRLAAFKAIELMDFTKTVGGVKVLAVKVDETGADALRSLTDSLRDRLPDVVCVLASVAEDGNVRFAAACGPEAVSKGAHAGNILKAVAKICGGGGGGRPDSATAGGKDASKLEEALEAVNNIVADMLK
ncbi:MAG: alanine--tRNA ligase [Clostridia bacterium]|nr:alanine--tRNA ligase [Clostridia bacterium]